MNNSKKIPNSDKASKNGADTVNEEQFQKELARMFARLEPAAVQKERIWNRLQENPHSRCHTAIRTAFAAACILCVCFLGAAGVNAATDGALLESVRHFCGLQKEQQEIASESIALPNEVYASNLMACSSDYIIFANERGLMIYDRFYNALVEAFDLQSIDCNYFNAQTIETHIYPKDDKLYIFNQKVTSRDEIGLHALTFAAPRKAYIYDLTKTGQKDAVTEITDSKLLSELQHNWEKYQKNIFLDTFDTLQKYSYDVNKISEKGEAAYSENCIRWKDADGNNLVSFLVVTSENVYKLYSFSDHNIEPSIDTLSIETSDSESETNAGLPDFKYTGDDKILEAICTESTNDWVGDSSEQGVAFIPAPVILDTVKEGDDIMVFCILNSYGYYRNGNTLNCMSGGGSASRLRLSPCGNGKYRVTERIDAGDGSLYARDIKKFCKGYPVSPDLYFQYTNKQEEKIRNDLLYMYIADNHLDIQYYKDYGWDPVKIKEPQS